MKIIFRFKSAHLVIHEDQNQSNVLEHYTFHEKAMSPKSTKPEAMVRNHWKIFFHHQKNLKKNKDTFSETDGNNEFFGKNIFTKS